MPVTTTYPGVYIEEVPSGVRTITGVPTSITAFVGRTKRGPDNEPITINSYGDFERIFGGLWKESALSYAVRDFYLNGGSQAIIVRLFQPNFADEAERQAVQTAANDVAAAAAGADGNEAAANARAAADAIIADAGKSQLAKDAADDVAKAAKAEADAGGDAAAVKTAAEDKAKTVAPVIRTMLEVAGLKLEAAEPGSWGANLRATVDVNVSADFAEAMDLVADKFFNLVVSEDVPGGTSESYHNLTFEDNSRRIDRVLKAQSNLVRWGDNKDPDPADYPQTIKDAHAAGEPEKKIIDDPVTKAQNALDDLLAEKLDDPTKDQDNAQEDQKRADLKAAKDGLAATDGEALDKNTFIGPNLEGNKEGLYALQKADLFNILCIPPYKVDKPDVDPSLVAAAAVYCEKRRAMLLVDPLSDWNDKNDPKTGVDQVGTRSKNAALFFPRLRKPDPLDDDRLADFVPCGAVAGIFGRTDTERGVWKAPAGLAATLVGVPQLSVPLTDAENGELNPLGINCLRSLPPAGRVVWGSRTLRGDDRLASEWKYIPVRRTALFIEESLYRGTQWVVFEPNDEPLWAQIRLNVGAFMHNLFRQGAFQGQTPAEAYLVKCDSETTTQNDINLGVVNILVGFAPLKPAEFVVIKIQQLAGQIAT